MPNQNSEETDLLTVKEFAQALAIDETTVHKWIKAGLVETVTLPRRAGGRAYHRIKRSTLNGILNSNPLSSGVQQEVVDTMDDLFKGL